MWLKQFIISLILACLSGAVFANEDPRSSRDFYIENFGELSLEESAYADRAVTIFNKLLRVADNAKAKAPSLILVDSESWPWAIALPDNSIVLTKGALELCYENVTKDKGDTRLAMLLGHELAHLAEDDYWHRDVYLALTDSSPKADQQILQFIGERSGLVKSSKWKNIVRDRELKADDRGAFYVSLAGYDLTHLFDSKQSFFQYWAQKTATNQSDYYLTAEQRANYLESRLTNLVNLPEAYKAGLGLISMGYFEQAEVLYKSILRQFPAHEIYNNLGYVKLAQIDDARANSNETKFWLPLGLDINPSTPILLRGKSDNFIVHKNLNQSIGYFEQAVERRPDYVTGILNLTCAYFLARRYQKASAIIEDAQKQGIANPQLEMMNLIVLYASLKDKISIQQYVTEQFENLINQNPALYMANFNLAQILELENKTNRAQEHWQLLAQNIDEIPYEYQKIVSQKANLELPDRKQQSLEPLIALLLEQIRLTDDTNSTTEDYDSIQLTVSPAQSETLYKRQPLMNSINLPNQALMNVLAQCCGQPDHKQTSMLGELWVYQDGIAALHSDGNRTSALLISQVLQDQLLRLNHSQE